MISAILVCATILGFTQQKLNPAKNPKNVVPSSTVILKNGVDSMSYALGVIDATFFKTQGVEKVNFALMNQGFQDVLNGKATMLTPQQCDMTVREQLQALLRKKAQVNIDAGEKFLAENRKKPGVVVTPSGLQYEVITMGTGPRPVDTSVVKVDYDGYLITGVKFDSSRDRGQPATFSLNQVIRGWTEGLSLMPVGSRFKLYVPYTLGYGEQDRGSTIPGGSALVFDVELLGIQK